MPMLATLYALSQTLTFSFAFGNRGEFNVELDEIALFPLLYMEGYSEGVIEVNAVGAIRETYNLSLWLFAGQTFTAKPAERSGQIEALKNGGKRIVQALSIGHELTKVSFIAVSNVPISDKVLDGVRMQFSATPVTSENLC